MEEFLNGVDDKKDLFDATEMDLINALRFFVGKIVEQEIAPKVPSHGYVSALTGLVYSLLKERIPRDLVLFSKHAGRASIKDEDFLLFCRKTSLREILTEYKQNKGEETKSKKKKIDDSE
jgi:histone H3/H4